MPCKLPKATRRSTHQQSARLPWRGFFPTGTQQQHPDKESQTRKDYIKQRLRLERGASFPQVDAKIGYDYNPVLATQFILGDVLGRPGEPYVPIQFGQPWSLTGSVDFEQVLYSEAGRRSLPATCRYPKPV
ncbi:MAG: hypothetical protein IPL65_14600 [Lewinellaceae bacterium]|nr:hypothetical protein [Lewinellaceae bacterium]